MNATVTGSNAEPSADIDRYDAFTAPGERVTPDSNNLVGFQYMHLKAQVCKESG
jgi:hypothetical protein